MGTQWVWYAVGWVRSGVGTQWAVPVGLPPARAPLLTRVLDEAGELGESDAVFDSDEVGGGLAECDETEDDADHTLEHLPHEERPEAATHAKMLVAPCDVAGGGTDEGGGGVRGSCGGHAVAGADADACPPQTRAPSARGAYSRT